MEEEKKEIPEEKSEEKKEEKPIFEEKPKEIKKESHVHHSSKENSVLTDKMRENPWIVSTLVLGIITLILLVGTFSGGMAGKVISGDDAGQIIVDFANSQDIDAELVGVEKKSGLYEVTLLMEEREVPVYLTLDGENFIGGLTPLSYFASDSETTDSSDTSAEIEVTKSDKPVVELFVMTHCPYGTQAEKGIISAIEALGNAVNAKIRFVHYFMHDPEEAETPRQVCIREEQSDKWYDYLVCFLEDGDSDRCISEVGIDEHAMDECISSGRSDEYYEEDSTLSQNYGVSGSPTLVINGAIVSSARDSTSYLNTICGAFNNAPEECDVELSSASPSPGFGWEGSSSGTTASCA